jgi:hypothetical protein
MYTYFYRALSIVLLLTVVQHVSGQGKKIEKTYHWKQQVNEQVNFTFNNYDCDLVIHTWDRPEIAYSMSVDATLKSDEDARRLDAYIAELEFSYSNGGSKFDNRFWTSKKAVMGRKTITLKGEKTIGFSEFNMKGEMWIPENCNLILQSKYSEIMVDDLNGRVTLDLYNDKLFGGLVNSNIDIRAKYSTLEFKDMKDVKIDFYNTDMEAGVIGRLEAVSKYSNFTSGDAGEIRIDSYNDKYSFENTGDIRFVGKYSDLKALNAGYIELDTYNGTVSFTQVEDMDLRSKYGKYEIGVARNLNIPSSFNDSYKIGKLDALNITESKYTVYKIDYLESSFILTEGYSDKFYVTETGAFKGMKLNGKYILLEMALDKDLDYSFEASVKYPKFEINEEAMDVKIKIKEGSDLQIKAVKGTETEGMPAFFVNGYEMAVTLTEHF